MIVPLLAHIGLSHLTLDLIGLSLSVLFAAVAGGWLAIGAVRKRRAALTELDLSR